MKRPILVISLQDQDARPLGKVRIVLKNLTAGNPTDDLPGKDTVVCQFVIAMFRNPDLLATHKFKDSLESLTHELGTGFSLMGRRPLGRLPG